MRAGRKLCALVLGLLASACATPGPGERLFGELAWNAAPMWVTECGSRERVEIEVADVFSEWFTRSAEKLAAGDPAGAVLVDLRGRRAAAFHVDRVVSMQRGACP